MSSQLNFDFIPAAEGDGQGTLLHTRALKQSYTYDSQNRLQYTPANGVITSSDFQQAFQAAITSSSTAGMVLAPGSYQVLLLSLELGFAALSKLDRQCETMAWCG